MRRWFGLVARLGLGGVWIYAGWLKVDDLDASVQAVRAYQILPYEVADVVGRVLPMLEVVLGVCLVLGLLVRGSGVLSALLQLAFIAGIVSVWVRGISIDCGCFGDGGYDPDAESKYPWEIARDTGLLLLSLFLVRWPRTALALDNVLFPPASATAAEARPDEDVDVSTRP